ncbi:permease family-domain-containing protein [Dunaliella salina]|uniref:Permease family-domain-containing protein n=1 Tax=Dunaliella salina TaxID=3046 RepID=A0ABZ3KF54_DUNSA|nr:permease family-domain-containing protein [Dunaliella salina]KAF5827802.1 permease family-domain-containing protein [Dunaliella salina]|eukprot:KAF5827801.1 permease family-domain-containing protein [Dunaliella salina]
MEVGEVFQLYGRFFSISARGSSVATEIRAGVATFLTMSAILLTNPQILSKAGLPTAAVTSSTAMTSCLATLAIGLIANLPFGMAPGMGLNAYFAYNQILGEEIPVDCAFAGCFAAAVAVAILAAVGALGFILRMAPDTIKMAVVVGMGLLLSFIGLQAAHVVVPVKETLVGLGNLQSTNVWLVVFGLSLIVALQYRGFKAAILIGVAATAAGHFLISSEWPHRYVSLPDFRHFGLDFSELLKLNGRAYSAVLAYVLALHWGQPPVQRLSSWQQKARLASNKEDARVLWQSPLPSALPHLSFLLLSSSPFQALQLHQS